jgi:ribonucleoside-diphosphate reductase alpha chain
VDWYALSHTVAVATRFLDDVVDANAYVPAVPQLKEAALRARRLGLGIMGLADLMYHVGIRYGSQESLEFAAQVMEFIRYHAMLMSIELAKQRSPFDGIKGSIYDPEDLSWTPPEPLNPYTHNWNRPHLDWVKIIQGIQENGIRNAAQTTIAPTGTIATVAGCEGYGCEPVFALAYTRHMNDNGKDLHLNYTSPLFEKALIDAGIDESNRQVIIEHVLEVGTCQDLDGSINGSIDKVLPEQVKNIFVVSQDITAEEHVRMQAALQAFVDNSLSKTVNFPPDALEEDVATAYQLAWELNCKGITVYVTGSRQKVVLETSETAKGKQLPITDQIEVEGDARQLTIWNEKKKPRPRCLSGYTFQINTPLGKAFVTINENGDEQPFEVFINTAKAGSETAAVSEAIGRLSSYILRLASPVAPRDRLIEIIRQLSGIGGGSSWGFGPNRVRSLPDGVSQALQEYIDNYKQGELLDNNFKHSDRDQAKMQHYTDKPIIKIGDLCPDCGQAAVVNEEGCRKCYACAYSEC